MMDLNLILGYIKLDMAPVNDTLPACLSPELIPLMPAAEKNIRPMKEVLEFPSSEVYVPHNIYRLVWMLKCEEWAFTQLKTLFSVWRPTEDDSRTIAKFRAYLKHLLPVMLPHYIVNVLIVHLWTSPIPITLCPSLFKGIFATRL